MIICLCAILLSASSELLLTLFNDETLITGFVLAPNKDLAVSVLHYCRNIPLLECIAFQLCRFCSHLAHYCGRPLAAIILSALAGEMVFGLSSLHLRKEQSLILLRHLISTNFVGRCQPLLNNGEKA